MIRVDFDYTKSHWLVEVARPGKPYVIQADYDIFVSAIHSLLRLAIEQYPLPIESISFGPVDPNSKEVHRIRQDLIALTL